MRCANARSIPYLDSKASVGCSDVKAQYVNSGQSARDCYTCIHYRFVLHFYIDAWKHIIKYRG